MSALDTPTPDEPDLDPFDVQRAQAAAGLLAAFNALGVLGAADVHVATRLGALGGEPDESVLLAAALTVRALRSGSVCLDLATARSVTAVEGVSEQRLAELPWPPPEEWTEAVRASPLVCTSAAPQDDRPLRLRGDTLYLDRYWRQERAIAATLDAAALRPPPGPDLALLTASLDRLFAGGPMAGDRQRLAAWLVAQRWVTVLAGGPGTGKTTTVARLLVVLQDQSETPLRVALAAPTAVAAARLTAAVRGVARHLDEAHRAQVAGLEATTLHRLLGHRPGSRTRFRHDHDDRLPFDVVVVDEASMVSLTMMSRLVDALRPDTRLVLVGDPDQLASVEAGAVLGDLVEREPPPGAAQLELPEAEGSAPGWPAVAGSPDQPDQDDLRRGVVRLSTVHRFSTRIASLADAVRAGDPERVLSVLTEGSPGVEFVDTETAGEAVAPWASLRGDVVEAGADVYAAAREGDAERALLALARHRILCGHRTGPYGVGRWGEQVEAWLHEEVPGYPRAASRERWYVGRPILVTSNDYRLRLFNGDTGVVVEADGQPRVAVNRAGHVDLLPPSRLGDVATVHAMSVHRSQGSQFDRVTLVLPPPDSPLLTRELLYTAVTRAKEHVRVVGTRASLAVAVRRPVVRASGLRVRA